MTTKVASPRARKSFSRIENVLELPNLIDIQIASFKWFLDEGLRETIDDISPIEDYTGSLAVTIANCTAGYSRTYRLGRWSLDSKPLKPARRRKR